MEIDYPSNPNHFEKHDIERQSHELGKQETEDDVSIEVLDHNFLSSRKTRDKSPSQCSQPHKKMKTSPFGKGTHLSVFLFRLACSLKDMSMLLTLYIGVISHIFFSEV